MSDSIPTPEPETTEPRRKPLSKSLRYQILRRDNHTCRYCGATAPESKIGIDHVVPVALGGTDEPANLVACCQDCNSGKAATDPGAALVADVAQDALRWKAAREAAAKMAAADVGTVKAVVQEVIDAWAFEWKTGYGLPGYPPLPADAETSIEMWHKRGLPVSVMTNLVEVTMRKYLAVKYMSQYKLWRYYAGCCWNALRDIEARAQQILNQEAAPDAP